VDDTPSSFEFAATDRIYLIIEQGFPPEFSQKLLLVGTQSLGSHRYVLEAAKKGGS
jgi:hypothetical protein